ncbi:uncharacterized protein LOC120189641 [Hibiscus syriacus]|uniref:uncharacterized protein LOC120189641 n=1 Tax=Hibiscus syriacus TaxID=106335 RepID=UPI001921B96F|nr:uncharacterized protein LOC120189641 [Hibiscus syriacus]
MLTFVASCIRWVMSSELVAGSNKRLYTTSKEKSFFDDSIPSTKPLLEVKDRDDMERSRSDFYSKGSPIKVKVKMTKQEAARLLSKCKDGGVLEFRDVAEAIANLPMDRVNVVNPDSLAEHSQLAESADSRSVSYCMSKHTYTT